jgi:hypothetical protein
MNLNKVIQIWKKLMAKSKKKIGQTKTSLPLSVQLIPVVKDRVEFQDRAAEVKNILSNMIILATTRGRPSTKEEETPNAA